MELRRIIDIYRIDYPELDERIEDEPSGLFLKICENGLGIRINIDNSGQNIEWEIQSFSELMNFLDDYYGELIKITNQSTLSILLGKYILNIYFALIKSDVIKGENFKMFHSNYVGVQIITENEILTFYNSGDEGKFTFRLPKCPLPFFYENIDWIDESKHFRNNND
jgi:hypothetical protein